MAQVITETTKIIFEKGIPSLQKGYLQGIIISGSLGSGKSYTLLSIRDKFEHCIYIDCFDYHQNETFFLDTLNSFRSPNVIFLLDNIEIICPDLIIPSQSISQRMVSSVLISNLQSNHFRFIGTTHHPKKVNRCLFSELSICSIELQPPTEEERRNYFIKFVSNLFPNEFDVNLVQKLQSLSVRTKGFTMGDLNRLVHNAALNNCTALIFNEPTVLPSIAFRSTHNTLLSRIPSHTFCDSLNQEIDNTEPLLISSLTSSQLVHPSHFSKPIFVGYSSLLRSLVRLVLCTTAAASPSTDQPENPGHHKMNIKSSLIYHSLLTQHSLPPSSGLLIHGSPGCGKTSLARLLAYHGRGMFRLMEVPCAELVRKVVGESEARLVQIFSTAKLLAPCFILLDNIEILLGMNGAKGDTGGGRTSHQALDRVLSQLLTEIDGIHSVRSQSSPIIVIATTSDMSSIDRSLLRPGRLEEHIQIQPPNQFQRKKILRFYLEAKFPFLKEPVLGHEIKQRVDRALDQVLLSRQKETISAAELIQLIENASWGEMRKISQKLDKESDETSDVASLFSYLQTLESL